ncbi:MAG: 3-isopropylmalate dehydrogenase [Rickettsiales bacterium]
MASSKNILLLPGDGIGKEIVSQAVKVLRALESAGSARFNFTDALIGGSAYDEAGDPFPEETAKAAKASDAILMGAVGGPQWDDLPRAKRPERGLLAIRKRLGLFANLRPAVTFDALLDASSLKREVIEGLDILIVRELTGDVYFGEPRGIEELPNGERRGLNTMVYTSSEVRRIGRVAFEAAKKRGGRVCSVDKANVLECTEMWRQEMIALRDQEYRDLELSHMYVDNAAMQLVRAPKQFDVVVTGNIFGDILSDCAAMLTGSLGMLPSASLGAEGAPGLYEPVHGSAPDIAGKNVANPLATILSASMMLRHSLDLPKCADVVDNAVRAALKDGYRTADIAQKGANTVSTEEMGNAVAERIAQSVAQAA